MSFTHSFKRALGLAPVVHPVERGLAKRWIKQRLLAVFPELRGDPKALHAAYQSLSLDPSVGNDGNKFFQISTHREPEQ